MSRQPEPQQAYKRSTPQSGRVDDSEVRDDWLDRFASFNQHFGRFALDTLGILLIAIALMTLLALGKYTTGVLLTLWTNWLLYWCGWGAYLIAIAIGYLGYVFLRRRRILLPWGRLFALEIAALLTLGLLAARDGISLFRAVSGMDGGRRRWGRWPS